MGARCSEARGTRDVYILPLVCVCAFLNRPCPAAAEEKVREHLTFRATYVVDRTETEFTFGDDQDFEQLHLDDYDRLWVLLKEARDA